MHRLININIITVLIFFTVCISYEILAMCMLGAINYTFFMSYIPSFLVASVDLQHFHYLKAATMRFKILNEYLGAIEKEKNLFIKGNHNQSLCRIQRALKLYRTSLRDSYSEWLSYVSDATRCKFKSPYGRKLSVGTLQTTCITSDLVSVLQMIFELHLELTDMCNLFNRAFTFQMLIKTAINFVCFLMQIYSILHSTELFYTIIDVLILLYLLTELSACIFATDSAKTEVNI